ncbi:hypothetical protein PHMEG_00037048 [Phytophthora megakarya]|uniref:Uncharacterized protein n=1 Tax=Phytophthora megakarya TaxID=4795 RepID=A0A225UJZ0_9STRA|nr:hypothetical protein PHMEG_00037048 [Phytophthora megakarya]
MWGRTHPRHFKKFVRRQADILDLWHWLKLHPDAPSNVRDGRYMVDEFDKLEPSSPTPTRESPNNSTPTTRGTNNKRALARHKTTPDEDGENGGRIDGHITYFGPTDHGCTRSGGDAGYGGRPQGCRANLSRTLQERINDIQCEMTSASSPKKLRLQRDLKFYLEERTRIMESIRSQAF